jgi:polyhydroxyalkanoate synthesis repressor PhaR
MTDGDANEPITIKKYANRRLYNTATSSYVTLDDLAEMVKAGNDFTVADAKSGADITRSVLTQIIFEEENKGGQTMLPISFLRQLIRFYGDSLQSVVPNYLDCSMRAFTDNQERMRDYMKGTIGGIFPFGAWDEIGKQNAAMLERTMNMFAPFAANQRGGSAADEAGTGVAEPAPGDSAAPDDTDRDALNALKNQLETLQQQVESLSRNKKS